MLGESRKEDGGAAGENGDHGAQNLHHHERILTPLGICYTYTVLLNNIDTFRPDVLMSRTLFQQQAPPSIQPTVWFSS